MSTNPPPRPIALRVQPQNIPGELKFRSQWVLWRYEWRDDRWTKPPYFAVGKYADSTDPKTWHTFQDALAVYRCPEQAWDGIGFVHLPEDNIAAGDADDCRNAETGTITGDDAAALFELDTYTEVSPSGTGIRTFAFGKKPGRSCKRGNFELYDGITADGGAGGRFLTVTGHRLDIAPATIEHRQEEIDTVYYRYWPKRPDPEPRATSSGPPASDFEILNLMFAAKNGARIRALYNGDTSAHGGDDSSADLALCSHLAFWFGKDVARIESAFNGSALGARSKWRDRPDYRARTIAKATAGTHDAYSPRGPRVKFNPPGPGAGEAPTVDAPAGLTGAQIILAYFQRRYESEFRNGNTIVTRDGEAVTKSAACEAPNSAILKQLEAATDAPQHKGGAGVNRNSLPAFFKTWAPVAWGDLLESLQSERQSDSELAREQFRRAVRDAMLTQLVLGNLIGSRLDFNQTERRSLVDWCKKFAKPGPWRAIRSYRCWTKCRAVGGQIELYVGIRQELFAQLKADRRLVDMGENTFSRIATRHGVGTSAREDRIHGHSAVVLTPDFLAELLVPECDVDHPPSEPNLVGSEEPNAPPTANQFSDHAQAS